jgi:hypothetical protein
VPTRISPAARGLPIRFGDMFPGKDATLIAEFIDAGRLGMLG